MRLLRIDREVIAMTTGLTHNAPAVARVKVAKRIVVPPNSMAQYMIIIGVISVSKYGILFNHWSV